MSSEERQGFVKIVEDLLSKDPPGKIYTMGGCLYVYLSQWVFVIVGDRWMEVTVCARHEGLGDGEAEDANEESILDEFRTGLGARLMERGWEETSSRTTETTMSEQSSSTMVVTEVVSRRDISDPRAAYEEILWLTSRSGALPEPPPVD